MYMASNGIGDAVQHPGMGGNGSVPFASATTAGSDEWSAGLQGDVIGGDQAELVIPQPCRGRFAVFGTAASSVVARAGAVDMRDPAEANEQDVAGRESSTLAAGGRLLFVDRDLLVVLMVDGPAALSAVMVHVEQYPRAGDTASAT